MAGRSSELELEYDDMLLAMMSNLLVGVDNTST